MPRLLDNRVIGSNVDVLTRVLAGSTPGYAMQVGPTGNNLILAPSQSGTGAMGPTGQIGPLGPVAVYSLLTKEAIKNNEGSSAQQWLCSLWTDITPDSMFDTVNGIAYGKGFFVVVGEKGSTPVIAYTSIQTATTPTWTEASTVPFTGTKIFGVTFDNDRFMACGDNSEIAYSSVGIDWTLADTSAITNFSSAIYRVAYGYPHGWVAVGTSSLTPSSSGVTLTSKDGIIWTELATPALDDATYTGVPIYGLAFGGGIFVAVGGTSGSTPTNHIATSVDGTTWTIQQSSQPNAAHYSIDFGNGRFVVGTNGTNPPVGGGIKYPSCIIGSNSGDYWYDSSVTSSLGNVQAVSFGNGVFIAGARSAIHITADGINFFAPYTTGWSSSASSSSYGNGIFVVGNRSGKIIRSATLPEYIASLVTATTPPTSGNGNNGGPELNVEPSEFDLNAETVQV